MKPSFGHAVNSLFPFLLLHSFHHPIKNKAKQMHAIRSTQAPNAIRRLVTQTATHKSPLLLPVHSLPRALIATRGGVFLQTPSFFAAKKNGFSTSSKSATTATTDFQAELLEGVTFGKDSRKRVWRTPLHRVRSLQLIHRSLTYQYFFILSIECR